MKTATGALIVAAGLAWAAQAAAAGPLDRLYERAFMSAADGRCRLFEPAVAQALTMGELQARGAALRSGAGEAKVAEVRELASRRAASTPCDHRDLEVAAARVRDAFAAWSKVTRTTFPGEASDWIADRTAYRSARWRLSQTVEAEGGVTAVFGVAGRQEAAALTVVALFADGRRPSAARLVLRDVERFPEPWLNTRNPLPPRASARVVLAEARAEPEAGLTPAGADPTRATGFRFPAAAAARLAALDPRERFAVEFVFPDGSVRTARFEVGDFAAARVFVSAAR